MLIALPALLVLLPATQDFGTTERLSRPSGGGVASGNTFPNVRWSALSADGRYAVFTSQAPDLVPNDTNGVADVFIRDRELGTTRRVSVGSGGQQGDGATRGCDVSDDGRFVAFTSSASNLVAGDTNGVRDVFLRDLDLGTTTLVSGPGPTVVGDGISEHPSISGDGAMVVYSSIATNLVPGDSNQRVDVFLFDAATGQNRRLSEGPGGAGGDGNSQLPDISADGQWVAFESSAQNLGPVDPSITTDIYVSPSAPGGPMIRIVGPSGSLSARSAAPRISSDGRFVAFESRAVNLIAGGNTNGVHIARWDRVSGTIEIASRDLGGAVAGGVSGDPCISGSGDLVAFRSFESDLAPGDTNGREDIFVRHMAEGWTERVSLEADGDQIDSAASRAPALSGSGRFTAFASAANGIVPGDLGSNGDVFVRDRGHDELFAGAEYCSSNPNSTGVAARTVAIGSPRLPANDLTLSTVSLPPQQFGFYFTSSVTGFVPLFGGSQGNLCVGGSIVRLDGFIQNSGALGRVSLPLPFGQLPPGASFAVGQRWNFQYWFRDVVGGAPTSNTSSASAVIWRP